MSINIVVCANLNGAIGYKGELLYKFKSDMQHFRTITTHNEHNVKNICVMGLHTYEEMNKPLQNRINVVLTRQSQSKFPKEVIVEDSLSKIINHYNSGEQEKELFLLGGQRVFEEAFELDCVDKIYMTLVHDSEDKKADTYFPMHYLDNYTKTYIQNNYCDEGGYWYEFITYERKKGELQ